MKPPRIGASLGLLLGLVAAPAFAGVTSQGSTELLQSVRKWANDIAKKKGTSVKWIDFHAEQPDMQQYKDMQLSASAQNCAFDVDEFSDEPPKTFRIDFKNPTNEKQVKKITGIYTTKNTSSWTVNNTSEDGWDLSIEANVALKPPTNATSSAPEPGGKVGFNLSHKVKLSTDQAQSFEESVSWQDGTELTISPRVWQKGRVSVDMKKFAGRFSCDVVYRGNVAVWFNDKIDLANGNDYHWLWFPTIDNVLRESPSPAFSVEGDAVVEKLTGNFHGFQGVDSDVALDDPKPLGGGAPLASSQPQPQPQLKQEAPSAPDSNGETIAGADEQADSGSDGTQAGQGMDE